MITFGTKKEVFLQLCISISLCRYIGTFIDSRLIIKNNFIDSKKKDPAAMSSPIWISEELQPWPDKNNALKFKKIAAIYSEFIGISENGDLHQWRWSDIEPYKSEVYN